MPICRAQSRFPLTKFTSCIFLNQPINNGFSRLSVFRSFPFLSSDSNPVIWVRSKHFRWSSTRLQLQKNLSLAGYSLRSQVVVLELVSLFVHTLQPQLLFVLTRPHSSEYFCVDPPEQFCFLLLACCYIQTTSSHNV